MMLTAVWQYSFRLGQDMFKLIFILFWALVQFSTFEKTIQNVMKKYEYNSYNNV